MNLLQKQQKRDELLSQYDFSKLAESEQDPIVKRRISALSILKNGKTIKEASDELKASPKSIRKWISKIEKFGLGGLVTQKTTGRRSKLKDDEIKRMHDEVTIFVKSFHEKNKRICAKHLMRFIEKEFKIDYSRETIYKMLRNLGLKIMPKKIRIK